MILAEVPSVITDAGVIGGAVVAVGGALTFTYRAFRGAVADIVAEQLAPIHEQLRPNGGKSLRDRVDRIETKVDTLAGRGRWPSPTTPTEE